MSSGCSGSSVRTYLEKMSLAASASGRSILILTSSRPGRRIAGSIMSSRLEAPMTMTFSRPSTPSISLSSWGTIVFSTSLDTPEPRVRKIESISSKNTMTGMPSLAFSLARWKTSLMCRSVSPTYLFSSSGPLMLRKKLLPSLARHPRGILRRLGRDLLGQRVRHRLGDQRLAAAGRPVEQDPLRRLELVLLEQVGVQVGQLDGVPDLLDLPSQAADVVVGDVRHFLQDELLHLGLGDPLVHVPRPGLKQQRVAGPQRLVQQRLGQPDHALLVSLGDDQRTLGVGEDLLEHDDLAHRLVRLGDDDVERLVEHDFLARAQLAELHVRGDVHPHLAAAGEHVARVVLVRVQEDAEPGRRLGQPVHFFLQRDDLVACLTQCRRQPLVLGGNPGEIPLGIAQPVLKEPDLPGRIRQPAPQHGDLLIKEGDLSGKAPHLILVPRSTPAVISGGHGPHLLLHR